MTAPELQRLRATYRRWRRVWTTETGRAPAEFTALVREALAREALPETPKLWTRLAYEIASGNYLYCSLKRAGF